MFRIRKLDFWRNVRQQLIFKDKIENLLFMTIWCFFSVNKASNTIVFTCKNNSCLIKELGIYKNSTNSSYKNVLDKEKIVANHKSSI